MAITYTITSDSSILNVWSQQNDGSPNFQDSCKAISTICHEQKMSGTLGFDHLLSATFCGGFAG